MKARALIQFERLFQRAKKVHRRTVSQVNEKGAPNAYGNVSLAVFGYIDVRKILSFCPRFITLEWIAIANHRREMDRTSLSLSLSLSLSFTLFLSFYVIPQYSTYLPPFYFTHVYEHMEASPADFAVATVFRASNKERERENLGFCTERHINPMSSLSP